MTRPKRLKVGDRVGLGDGMQGTVVRFSNIGICVNQDGYGEMVFERRDLRKLPDKKATGVLQREGE